MLDQLLEDVTALAAKAAWGVEPTLVGVLLEPWESGDQDGVTDPAKDW